MRVAFILAFTALVCGCAASRAEVAVAPVASARVTTSSAVRAPVCDFTRSHALSARAHELTSPSHAVVLGVVATILAESCSGPLATLASRLASDPVLAANRDSSGAPCDTPDARRAADAILRDVLAPLVVASCFSEAEEVTATCPIPWDLASLWVSQEEWAEARFFPESERAHPAALPRGPSLALASAITGSDRSFTARSLAAHVLAFPAPPKELASVDGTRVCRALEEP